jgi:hypothetical protein
MCPSICHYFEDDIVPAGNRAVGSGVMSFVCCVLAALLAVALKYVPAF